MSGPLLVKPAEAGEILGGISRRTVYNLMQTNADIRAAIVEIPGVRGKFLSVERLRNAIERMSPLVVEQHGRRS